MYPHRAICQFTHAEESHFSTGFWVGANQFQVAAHALYYVVQNPVLTPVAIPVERLRIVCDMPTGGGCASR